MSRAPYATNQPKQVAEEEEIAGLPGDEDDVMVDEAAEEQGYGMYESYMKASYKPKYYHVPDSNNSLRGHEHVESSLCVHVTIHSQTLFFFQLSWIVWTSHLLPNPSPFLQHRRPRHRL